MNTIVISASGIQIPSEASNQTFYLESHYHEAHTTVSTNTFGSEHLFDIELYESGLPILIVFIAITGIIKKAFPYKRNGPGP